MPIPIFEIVYLVDDAETIRALRISVEDLEQLVRAERLPAIYIVGKRRVLYQDVQALVTTYQPVHPRR